jgi:hypothetical protein
MQIAHGQYPLARETLDSVAAQLPASDPRRILLKVREGDLAYARRLYDAAREGYSEAIVLGSRLGIADSTVASAYHGLALYHSATGDDAAAASAVRKALGIEPTDTRRLMLEGYEKRLAAPR